MRKKAWLGLLLATMAMSGEAQSNQWLKQLIQEKKAAPVRNVKEIEMNKKRHGFFSNHGFVLFYASTCPHCQEFSPVIKRWTDENHADILPLAFDNLPLPEFPRFAPATTEWVNTAFQGSPIQYPALFIVNPKHQTMYPVGFGSMSIQELDERVASLIPQIIAFEKREVR